MQNIAFGEKHREPDQNVIEAVPYTHLTLPTNREVPIYVLLVTT
mgnify:CR=1 FL=1